MTFIPVHRLARLEHLMGRRPELLSSVMLRQNPHNVHEWHKRARLFAGQPHKQILTYTEAVRTVDADKARLSRTLWSLLVAYFMHEISPMLLCLETGTEARSWRNQHGLLRADGAFPVGSNSVPSECPFC